MKATIMNIEHRDRALGWLLTSYVAIGLFETMYNIMRRLHRKAEFEREREREAAETTGPH